MTPAGSAHLARRACHAAATEDLLTLRQRIRTLRPATPPQAVNRLLQVKARVNRQLRAARVHMLWPSYIWR